MSESIQYKNVYLIFNLFYGNGYNGYYVQLQIIPS